MAISLQKANFWKRISAYLCDFIIVVILSVGFATVISAIIGYDKNTETMEGYYAAYEQEYGIDLTLSREDVSLLPQEMQEKYQAAELAFAKDKDVLALYSKMLSQTVLVLTFSLLLSCTITYFVVPLFLKNGQTVGKKVFGVAVMRTNCVKLTTPALFIRAIIGTYAIETMLPVLIIVMIYFGAMGFGGTLTLFGLLALQIGVLCATKTNSSIHDLLADSVVVDMASQRIFESEEALIAYKEEMHAQEVAQKEYA